MIKESMKLVKKDKNRYNKLIFIGIIILISWWIMSSFYENNDEYERCIDSCVYDNEFCASDFLVYFNGIECMSEQAYDSCFYDLKYCVQDCERN